ncbi:MAG: hypothetical protein COA50_14545 [Flavobacteriaceae bacterium]|nr:MAG: hypothetical protein COA50_14545 [Flavobacteriaceae bacterium]
MEFKNTAKHLNTLVSASLNADVKDWILLKIELITQNKSTKDLYLTYTLLASKVTAEPVKFTSDSELISFLKSQEMNALQLARIFLLVKTLEVDNDFFKVKVANLIQVADKTELETFLKFLVLLPNASDYISVAVDALRTNISSVFNAIALNNPYPAVYFNEQQWNQMYLKAVFIESELGEILNVDDRGNDDLSRIISDYAHERWAASREINPLFWRPVSKHINEKLLKDMQRLLASDAVVENKAGALCCHNSDNPKAKELLNGYPELKNEMEAGTLNWKNI